MDWPAKSIMKAVETNDHTTLDLPSSL